MHEVDIVVRLNSKDPLRWASPNSCVFMFDQRRRLSDVVTWLTKLSYRCNGNV